MSHNPASVQSSIHPLAAPLLFNLLACTVGLTRQWHLQHSSTQISSLTVCAELRKRWKMCPVARCPVGFVHLKSNEAFRTAVEVGQTCRTLAEPDLPHISSENPWNLRVLNSLICCSVLFTVYLRINMAIWVAQHIIFLSFHKHLPKMLVTYLLIHPASTLQMLADFLGALMLLNPVAFKLFFT